MNPDKFRKMCRSLGVNAKWLSEEVGVPQSVAQDWVDGSERASTEAIKRLRTLDQYLGEKSNRFSEQILRAGLGSTFRVVCYMTDEDLWEFIPEYGNLPAAAHRALVERVRRKLKPSGIDVIPVDLDRAKYLEWLGEREESSDTRLEWTGFQGHQQIIAEREASRHISPPTQTRGREKKTWKLKLNQERTAMFAIMEPITGDAYKALRISLGLSVECAAFISEVPVDTVKKWESGKVEVEDGSGYGLRLMNDLLDTMATDYFHDILETVESDGAILQNMKFALPVFCSNQSLWLFNPDRAPFPAKSYHLLVTRVLKKLSDAGCDASSVKIELKDYLKSLGGKRETEATRNAWLHTKLENHVLEGENIPESKVKRKKRSPTKH